MEDNNKYNGLEIAIIGMAGRFPGANNIHEFWNNLINKVESIEEISVEELKEAGVPQDLLNNKAYVKSGAFIENKEYFDAPFFNFTPIDAKYMAPHNRVFLETVWVALEDSGYVPDLFDGRIGVYAGSSSSSSWEGIAMSRAKKNTSNEAAEILSSSDFLSSHTSYRLNLKGPSVSLNTTCSTSNVAVHLACQALIAGECEMALAGGVTILNNKKKGYVFEEGNILSKTGHVRTFDEEADGTVFGEGVGVVVLKRLEDAINDKDHIYSVILGSAINNDGKQKVSYTAPSVKGQVALLKDALNAADVSPEDISYIETHGTATKVGDAIEIEALGKIFKNRKSNKCLLGAVKTNVGHLIQAAGIAGLIKTSLALQNKLIPPNQNFNNTNSNLKLHETPFVVNSDLHKWQKQSGKLKAGVSSFGIGGTNSHIILEEAPNILTSGNSRSKELVLLSAKSETALERVQENILEYLKSNKTKSIADIAFTLKVGRKVMEYKKMFICSDINEAIEILSSKDKQKIRSSISKDPANNITFMFSDLDFQYPNIGLDLYNSEELFKAEVDRCSEILISKYQIDIKKVLFQEAKSLNDKPQEIDRIDNSQLRVFIIEFALSKLMIKWGVKPKVVIGIGFGEYTAACISGAIPLEDVLELIVLRGELIMKVGKGLMTSVELPKKELEPLLVENLSLAFDNGDSCIISGKNFAVKKFEDQMKDEKIHTSRINSTYAMNSCLMDDILDEFERKISKLRLDSPKIPYISNVSGSFVNDEKLDSRYWVQHIRKTLKVSSSFETLVSSENNMIIEIGNGTKLNSILSSGLGDEDNIFKTSLLPNKEDNANVIEYLTDKIGELWLNGVKFNWEEIYSSEKRKRVALPTYPFEKERYWFGEEPLDKTTDLNVNCCSNNIDDWLYVREWSRNTMVNNIEHNKSDDSTILIFLDQFNNGLKIANILKRDNRKVLFVKTGERFKKTKEYYEINLTSYNDYQLLASDLKEENCLPDRIIHLLSLTTCSELGRKQLETCQYSGYYSLLCFVRGIQNFLNKDKVQIDVISNGLFSVLGNEVLYPEKSTILAPIMVIPQEFGVFQAKCIDVVLKDNGQISDSDFDRIANIINNTPQNGLIALRGNHSWQPEYKQLPYINYDKQSLPLKEKGNYLITGGLGRIGMAIANHLARTVEARLILLSRTKFPEIEDWNSWLESHEEDNQISKKIIKLKEILALGSEVCIVSADVSDLDGMTEAISITENKLGKVNGIIHSATVPDGSLIIKREKHLVEDVFKAKLYGTLVLDEVFSDHTLDFVIYFSSLSSVLGGIGQVGYCASNVFLDAFAHYKNEKKNVPTISISWDRWKNIEENNIIYNDTVDGLTMEQGLDCFDRIIKQDGLSHTLVSIKNLEQLVSDYVTNGKNLIELITDEGKGIVSHKTNPKIISQLQLNEDITLQTSTGAILSSMWKELLGHEKINPKDDFMQLGGDSLKAIKLFNEIEVTFGVTIDINDFFLNPTIEELALLIDSFLNISIHNQEKQVDSNDIII